MSREMKDSGVEWIGEIPEGWNVCKIDSLYYPRSTKVSDKDYLPLSVTMKGIVPQLSSTAKTDDHDNRKLVKKGDFAINSRSDRRGSCGISEYDGSVSLINTVLQPRHGMNNEYYNWLFHSDMFSSEFYRLGHGIVDDLRTTSWQEMKKMVIPAPSPTEQQQIVHFLDRKCTAIDTAIEKTKKSIEKLEEYKKAVITKAVTKGIDPNAKMKDAHFLWLTAIPENWGIYKLNHILDYNHPYPLGDGDHGSIKADSYVSSGIPFIRVQNLGYAEPINIENVVYITEAQNQKIQNSTLAPNDILFAKTGATIGKTAIMPQTISRANTTSHIGKITVDTRYYVPKYIFYALSSEIGNHQLWSIANKKATRPEVGLDEVKYIKLCIPLSVTEQKQIADFLDEKLNQINNAISNHANLIRKLEEYKKSLIYYAVTGKIDCRNEVI
jgi:type I restriction modification DNA specificity domain protein